MNAIFDALYIDVPVFLRMVPSPIGSHTDMSRPAQYTKVRFTRMAARYEIGTPDPVYQCGECKMPFILRTEDTKHLAHRCTHPDRYKEM